MTSWARFIHLLAPPVQFVQTLSEFLLEAAFNRLVIAAVFRQIGLGHPGVGVVVAVLVAFAMAERFGPPVVGIAQVLGDFKRAAGSDVLHGFANCDCRSV